MAGVKPLATTGGHRTGPNGVRTIVSDIESGCIGEVKEKNQKKKSRKGGGGHCGCGWIQVRVSLVYIGTWVELVERGCLVRFH